LQRRLAITTLYVTHDQSESMVMSDRIVVMFGGRIHQIGSPEDIYHRPATRDVAKFIGQANLIDGVVVECRDGTAMIDTTFGRIRCGTKETMAPGRRATAIVRPEAFYLAQERSNSDFRGRIAARHFLGNIVEYRIALTGSIEISLHALGGDVRGP